METVTLIGILAGACTTLAVVPQIIKSWRTKKVLDVSPLMFAVLILGVGLWVVYGILKNDIPIIVTNGLSVLLNKYKDVYNKQLMKIINNKTKGKKTKTQKIDTTPTQADDLMAKLKASLEKKKKNSKAS